MQGSIDTVQRLIYEDGKTLNTVKMPHKGPLTHGYNPELDTTDECDADHKLIYQQLIRIPRYSMELGGIKIQLEVALMSQ